MGFDIKKEKLCECECVNNSSEYNLETQLNLPDYCGDIKRILKCNITPSVGSVSVSAGKANVKGSAVIRMIYIAQKDKIDCCEITESFSCSCNLNDASDNSIVCVFPKINYVNCRATSQRRVSVSANIALNFTTYNEKANEIISNIQQDGIQIKTDTVLADNLVCIGKKVFEMSETATIPSDNEAIGKVLSVRNYAVIDSKKAVSGKLLIKGELYTKIIYCADNSDGEIEKFSHTMPISQIIDIPGLSEDCDLNVSADVIQSGSVVKSDSSGENRLVEIAVKVQVIVKGNNKDSYTVIDECYCTDYDIDSSYETKVFSRKIHSSDRQITVKKTLEMPTSVKKICHVWANDVSCDLKAEKNKATGKGSANISVIFIDEKDDVDYCEKNVDFDFEENFSESYDKMKCVCNLTARDISCDSVQKDKINLTAQIGVIADVYCEQEKKILSSVEISNEQTKKQSDAALVIYFADKNERIWDIAKKYNTTVEAILNENEITGDKTTDAVMLMIPCK